MKSAKSPVSAAREIKLSFSLAALVQLALGIFLLVAPNTSRALICTVVSIGVTAYGLFYLLNYALHKDSGAYTFELLIGVAAAAFGIFSIINPTFLMDILIIALGLIIAVTSVAAIKRALNLKAFGFDRWWMSMAPACITLLFALSVIFFNKAYGDLLMMLIGIFLVIEAVSDLISIRKLTGYAKSVKVTYTVGE